MDEHSPDTQPHGALNPPPRNPPTALATSAPQPPERPSTSRASVRRTGVRGAVDAVLDRLDTLGDRIADAAGLR